VPGFAVVGFYPGWSTDRKPPSAVNYAAFTGIAVFGMHPTTAGGLSWGSTSAETVRAQVAAAHAHGDAAILTIGSEGQGRNFVAATSEEHLAGFGQAIARAVRATGADAVDIDWAEHVTDHAGQYQALITQLGRRLSRPVTIDVDPGQVPPTVVAALQGAVSRVDVMSYWGTGAPEIHAYEQAGVPARRLMLGIGASRSYRDQSQADVAGKVAWAKNHGLAGVFVWQIGDLRRGGDARLAPLRQAAQQSPSATSSRGGHSGGPGVPASGPMVSGSARPAGPSGRQAAVGAVTGLLGWLVSGLAERGGTERES
jgi:hypothetical protein